MGAAPSPSKRHWLFKPARYKILWGARGGGRGPTCLVAQILDTLRGGLEPLQSCDCEHKLLVVVLAKLSTCSLAAGGVELPRKKCQSAKDGKLAIEFLMAGRRSESSAFLRVNQFLHEEENASVGGLTVWVDQANVFNGLVVSATAINALRCPVVSQNHLTH